MAEMANTNASQGQPQAQADSKNVFTELFGKDVSQKDSGLMNTVAQQQDKKTSSFFGLKKPQPDIISKLKGENLHKGKPGATFLQASILVLILVFAGFLTQNSASFSVFGVNPASRVEQGNEQVATLNAELRVQKHLAASLLLYKYSNLADQYFYNLNQSESAYISENKRADSKKTAEALRPALISLLSDIQGYVSEKIPNEEIPAAIAAIDKLIADLSAKTGEVASQSVLQDVQDLETAKTLMQSGVFKASIAGLNTAEITDAQLQTVYTDFGVINSSVSALIGKIKAERKEWSVYLDEIEGVTKSVDPLFNTEFPGNLKLDDIRMDSEGIITISGQTVTDDSKNFTLVSNLIDAFEGSEYFENVENRSYSKNDNPTEETYSGSFRISMQLTPQL